MQRYKEFDVDLALSPCITEGCQPWAEQGFKAINPKITRKLTKTMPQGDPYCEAIVEFKEEKE
jgi:hypothetical protein